MQKKKMHNVPAVNLQYSANQFSRKVDKLQLGNPRFSSGSAIMQVCNHWQQPSSTDCVIFYWEILLYFLWL